MYSKCLYVRGASQKRNAQISTNFLSFIPFMNCMHDRIFSHGNIVFLQATLLMSQNYFVIFSYGCTIFSHKTKSFVIQAVFAEKEMNYKEKLILFKIVFLAFNKLIPVSFLLVEGSLKLLFWYKIKQYLLNIFHILKSFHEDEFSVLETRKSYTGRGLFNAECYIYTILCFTEIYR